MCIFAKPLPPPFFSNFPILRGSERVLTLTHVRPFEMYKRSYQLARHSIPILAHHHGPRLPPHFPGSLSTLLCLKQRPHTAATLPPRHPHAAVRRPHSARRLHAAPAPHFSRPVLPLQANFWAAATLLREGCLRAA